MALANVACPEGFVAAPNASFRYPCWYLSPPHSHKFSSSLARCVDQCAENNAVPVCFSSDMEVDWVTEMWPLFINEGASAVWTGVYKIDQFREKPDLPTAKKYVADKSYAWNAGCKHCVGKETGV